MKRILKRKGRAAHICRVSVRFQSICHIVSWNLTQCGPPSWGAGGGVAVLELQLSWVPFPAHSAEAAQPWLPKEGGWNQCLGSVQGSTPNKLRFLPKVRLFCDLAIEFRMMSDAKWNPINCYNDPCCFGGSLWRCWECSWRSNSCIPSVTLDVCRAHMYNANPVWQASQTAPIDFSSATQPLSSPKQLCGDKQGRGGASSRTFSPTTSTASDARNLAA